jgi:lipoprotein-anchoring transpeptidase ErfK/SrfK
VGAGVGPSYTFVSLLMRKVSYLIPAALVALLVAGAAGVYAYDSSRARTIADGVSVAGVDVGGLTVKRARAKIAREVARPYERPIKVRAGGDRFELTAKEAAVEVNVRGMARDALAESRGGNLLTRTWRDLTGGEVDARLPARVSYSRDAVDDLVGEVEDAVNVPAQDAQVTPSGAGLSTEPAEAGVNLRSEVLRTAVVEELERPDRERSVKARAVRVPPEVTQGELVDEYPKYLTLDRSSYQLHYYEDLKLQETYTVAVGTTGFETPVGEYEIQNKAVDPAWNVPEWGGSLAGQTIPGGSPENPLKERWLGIYDGAGIHGTDDVGSLGTAASHGCVRMAIPDVIELYDRVPVGTPIYIE